MIWTEQTEVTLRRMWGEGQTASQISHALGISRNAVIGKAHRLALTKGRRAPAAPTSAPKTESAPPTKKTPLSDMTRAERARRTKGSLGLAAPSPALRKATFGPGARPPQAAAPAPCGIANAPAKGRLTFAEQRNGLCRYPYGDPRDFENMRFCGEVADIGETYCEAHKKVCYQPRAVRVAHDKRVRKGVTG